MATPIAAATAALFLEFMWQEFGDKKAAPGAKEFALDSTALHTPGGMQSIFHKIGIRKSSGEYFEYVMLWQLLHTTSGPESSIKRDRSQILSSMQEVISKHRI